MNENYNEKIHKIIENAFEEEKEYILEYANNKEYAFGKLEEKFKEFMQFEISQNDLEELQIDIENTPKGFNSKNFLNLSKGLSATRAKSFMTNQNQTACSKN